MRATVMFGATDVVIERGDEGEIECGLDAIASAGGDVQMTMERID